VIKTTICYRGVRYRNVFQMCKTLNLSTNAVYRRLSQGWSLERAIETPIKPRSGSVTYKGTLYDTVLDLAKETGINYSTLKKRLLKEEVEKAVTTPVKDVGKSVVYNNGHYSSIKDLAKVKNISYSLLLKRLINGLTVQEAVDKPVTNQVTYNGIKYRNLYRLTKELGVSYNTVYGRMLRGGVLINVLKEVLKKNEQK